MSLPERHNPTIAEIKAAVCETYGLGMQDMYSHRRARYVARPRQVAMYLCRVLTSHSLPAIGHHFGGRDHTTVMHAIRVIEKGALSTPSLMEDIKESCARIAHMTASRITDDAPEALAA